MPNENRRTNIRPHSKHTPARISHAKTRRFCANGIDRGRGRLYRFDQTGQLQIRHNHPTRHKGRRKPPPLCESAAADYFATRRNSRPSEQATEDQNPDADAQRIPTGNLSRQVTNHVNRKAHCFPPFWYRLGSPPEPTRKTPPGEPLQSQPQPQPITSPRGGTAATRAGHREPKSRCRCPTCNRWSPDPRGSLPYQQEMS